MQSSPLSILRKSLNLKKRGAPEISKDYTSLDTIIKFPKKELSTQTPLELEFNGFWNKQKTLLELTVSVFTPTFYPWEGMEGFFDRLNGELLPFLNQEQDGDWSGWLNPLYVNQAKDERLKPGYGLYLGYEGLTDNAFGKICRSHVERCAQAIFFSLPIFHLVSQGRLSLSSSDRLHILSRTFGNYQAGLKKPGAGSIFFPRGFYGGPSPPHVQ